MFAFYICIRRVILSFLQLYFNLLDYYQKKINDIFFSGNERDPGSIFDTPMYLYIYHGKSP